MGKVNLRDKLVAGSPPHDEPSEMPANITTFGLQNFPASLKTLKGESFVYSPALDQAKMEFTGFLFFFFFSNS